MIAAGGDKALNVNAVIGPSPCDDCPHARRCRVEHLACRAFTVFVTRRDGAGWQRYPREPRPWIYREMFV